LTGNAGRATIVQERPMRSRSVSLLLCSALVILAGCDARQPSPTDAPSPEARRSHRGYFIDMPLKAAPAGVETFDSAVVTVSSNLPDGTLAHLTTDAPGYGGESQAVQRFVRGRLTLRPGAQCDGDDDDLGRGFNVQVIVVPDISLLFLDNYRPACRRFTACGAGPFQDHSVQDVLGPNFERLRGDDVTTIFGTRALVASAHYAWPRNACRKPLDIPNGFPVTCPPSTATINEDQRGEDTGIVAQSIPRVLAHNRICDLYNFTTEEFRSRTPWPSFRARLKRWLQTKGHTPADQIFGQIVASGAETVGLAESPRFLDVEYRHGRPRVILRARFTATATRLGYTNWRIARLELL
jgi:hypothetical protein